MRAERLQDLGLVDTEHPDDVTPEQLGAWLTAAVTSSSTRDHDAVALDGLRRVPDLVAGLQPATAPHLDDLQEMAS